MRLRIHDLLSRHPTRSPPYLTRFRSREVRTSSTVAQAVGAAAFGVVAVGALAMGAVAIGRLAIARARIRRLEIDELVVRNLRVTETLQVPPKPETGS